MSNNYFDFKYEPPPPTQAWCVQTLHQYRYGREWISAYTMEYQDDYMTLERALEALRFMVLENPQSIYRAYNEVTHDIVMGDILHE